MIYFQGTAVSEVSYPQHPSFASVFPSLNQATSSDLHLKIRICYDTLVLLLWLLSPLFTSSDK